MEKDRRAINRAMKTIETLRESGAVINIAEAAQLLNVTRPAASQLITAGLIDAVTPAPIPRLVTRASVETYKAHRDAKGKAGRYEGDNAPPRYEN